MLLIESFCSVFMNTQRAKTIWQQARCLSAAQMLNSLVFTKTSFKISMKCKTENLYSYWRFRFMFRYYSTRNSRQEGFVYIWVVLYRKPEAHQYLREATAFCGCNAATPSPVVLCRFPVLWGGTADASPPHWFLHWGRWNSILLILSCAETPQFSSGGYSLDQTSVWAIPV